MAAVHLFLYLEVAPGKSFYFGSNSFNSNTNAAAAAAGAAAGAAAATAAAAAVAAAVPVLHTFPSKLPSTILISSSICKEFLEFWPLRIEFIPSYE